MRGFQVTPAELEAVLLSHPLIIEAAVIGIPSHASQGEAPRAYVVRRKTSDPLTESEIQEWFKGQVIKYKWLEGGVKFIDSMPKTGSGKILKRVLRDQARKELEAEGGQKSKL